MEEKVFQALTELSNKLGVAVEHLWEVLVKQAYYQGIGMLVGLITLVLVTAILGHILYKLFKIKYWEEHHFAGVIGAGVLLFFCALGVVVFLLGNVGELLAHFYNPEYIALMELKKFIK